MQPLTAYIRQPELIDADAVEQLAALVERFPYFQGARILYLRGLYQQQDDRFGNELRKAAICLPDRRKLFQLIEQKAMQPQGQPRRSRPKAAEPDAPAPDRTQSLIESFLADQPELPRQRKGRPVDASVDYIAYLMQQEDDDTPAAPVPVATHPDPVAAPPESDLQRPAASEPQQPARPEPQTIASTPLPDDADEHDFVEADPPLTDTQNADDDAFLTETLARIYIKQGKYIKAIEIIRRLSLRNPKKNRYFADQIRFLEKLIANERAKTDEISNNK